MKMRTGFIASAIAALTLIVAGCNQQTPQQQAAYAAAQQQAAQQQQPAPTIYQPPVDQIDPSLANNPNPVVSMNPVVASDYASYGVVLSDSSCPVAPSSLQRVLSGYYGVDVYGRPLNQALNPVDRMGYCVSLPVTPDQIRLVTGPSVISPFYVSFYGSYFHRPWAYQPGYYYNWGTVYGSGWHSYYGPVGVGVHIHTVTVQQYHPAASTVVTKEVIKQRTVVNNGAGVRLPGKGVGAPQSNGVRLPGKDQPQTAAPAGKTGFNFGKPGTSAPPAAAPAPKSGFNFGRTPAAAPAAAPAPKSGFNFSKPASAPSKPSGFSFKSSSPSHSSSGGSHRH